MVVRHGQVWTPARLPELEQDGLTGADRSCSTRGPHHLKDSLLQITTVQTRVYALAQAIYVSS
jgi:hypothetical protein